MGLVYWIHCNITEENYIGSTIQSLKKRLVNHTGKNNKCSSKQIIDRGDYDVIVLEDNIPNDILKVREQFYMDCCDNLVNVKEAIDTGYKKRYLETHKDHKAEYDKMYRAKNKDKYVKKIYCECGGSYLMKHKSTHFKTKRHMNYLGIILL